jgi:DNA-binding response OmpR family regulator
MIGTDEMTKRVLAIDDDETILAVMNNVLTMHDYEAVTASQWVEALDVLNEGTPDLLLLDLQMPHVDGFFLLEWIREQEIDLPVIVVSAYLDDESVARLETLGVDAFIWKPFNVNELIEKIDQMLAREPQTNAVVEPAILDEQEIIDPESESAEEPDGEDQPVRRRRVRRRRRGTKKRQRRRTALYLALIAVISLGISGLSIYMQTFSGADTVTTEEKPGGPGDSDLLKELLRAQIESQLQQGRVQAPPPKKMDLNLKRK